MGFSQRRICQEAAVAFDSLHVVDVEEAAAGAAERLLFGTRRL
jgi:hypothetical protein